MARDHDQQSLRRLLQLCQNLKETQALTPAPSTLSLRRHRELTRRARASLSRALAEEPGKSSLPSALKAAQRTHNFSANELTLLSLLLHQRIAEADPILDGRELMAALCDSSYEFLVKGSLLKPDGRLVSSGLVVPDTDSDTDPLDQTFSISESLYQHVARTALGLPAPLSPSGSSSPYGSALEHLADMRHLVSLCQRRAALLFPASYWIELHPEVADTAREIEDRILQARESMAKRERRTPESLRLPIVAFREEYGLGEEEELIIVALLFQELHVSGPLIEGAELVRLISKTEDHVFGMRRHLTRGARLQELGLVAVDREMDDKDLVNGVYLPDWVTERLLHQVEVPATIRHDEKRRFHDFLDGLDNSDEFFRKL